MPNIFVDSATLTTLKRIAEREDRKLVAVVKRAIQSYSEPATSPEAQESDR